MIEKEKRTGKEERKKKGMKVEKSGEEREKKRFKNKINLLHFPRKYVCFLSFKFSLRYFLNYKIT